MYCETTPDTFVQARSDSLPRDTFESILRSLYPHLCDNKQLAKQDKFSKLHPVINRWNKSIVKWDRLMECLTPTFWLEMFRDDYFTSFHLLTHLGVNNIRATRVLNKNRLCKCTIIGDKQLQKKERGHFKQRTSSKNAVQLWLEQWQGDLHSFNLVNLRDFFSVGTKLKERIFKTNNQINSTVITRTWVLSAEWTRTWPSTWLVSQWKNGGGPRSFEW